MRNSLKNKSVMLLFLIVYKFLLDTSYVLFVTDIYAYSGFVLDIAPFNYIISWGMVVLIASFTPIEVDRASNYFFMSASLFLLLPLVSLYSLTNWNAFPVVISIAAIKLINFLTNVKLKYKVRFSGVKEGRKISLYISLFFIFVLIAWYFLSGAVKYFNLDLTKVYDFREQSAELASVGIMAYINNWTYKVFLIYAISWSLLKRKFYLVVILLLVQVFFFGVSGHKSVLFTPLLIISIWWYFRRFKTLLVMPIGISFIVALSTLSFVFFDDVITSSLIIRRVLFVPAKLTYDYFSFFSINDFVYWSNSILSFFVDYNYSISVPLLIGEYEGSGASANNGFISSGYSHAGVFGVIIYSSILSILLRMLDFFVEKGVPVWFGLSMVFIPLRDTLISSDLLTTLLTHGLIVAFMLLLLSVEKTKVRYEI